MLSVSRFTLNTRDEEAQLSFSVKQGDTARRIIATLTENGEMFCLPDDCYAVFAANKSDGTKFNDSCVIQDGRIIYDLDPQLTLAVGRADCDITVYSSGGAVISTARFTMTVFESIFAGASDDMVSEDTFHVLNNLIGDANDTINDMEELNESVTAAEAGRVEAEEARETAEESRETSETERETAEAARASAESTRETAESAREVAEAARASAESARVTAESARVIAESGRVEAEKEREKAEQARADETAGIVAQAAVQATAAAASAAAAEQSEVNATAAAESALSSATIATSSKENAAASAAAAAEDAEVAEASAIAAESWAVGGTGTREGEDANNAKYWCSQAQQVAGGDFAPLKHTHNASDITTGTLSISRGGTGADTAEQARVNLGVAAAIHTHSIDDITDYEPEDPPTLTEGTTNGTVNYGGTNVPVHGLGSAAYTESTAYDSAGSAAAVGTNLSAHVSDKVNPHNVTAAQTGAAAESHTHTVDDITDFPATMPPSAHTHNASDINAGTLDTARMPVVPVDKGGTGATTAAQALINLGITATASEINSLNGVSSNIQGQISSLQAEVSGGGMLNNNTNGWKTKVLTSANFDSAKRAFVTFEYKRFLLYGTDFADSNNNGYHVVLIDFNSEDFLLVWGYNNSNPECKMYTDYEISGGYYAPLCTGAEVYKGNLYSNQLIIKINGAGKTSGTLYYIQI